MEIKTDMEVIQHRRAQILNSLANLFEMLKAPIEKSGLPIQVMTVQKRYTHWAALDRQGAIPALLLTYGDNGEAPDSDVVGYIDEKFPIACTAVMKEEPHLKDLTDQTSDMHYSIERLIHSNRTLGVEGVLPEKTRIRGWRGSEGAVSKFEIIKFRVIVVHRYHETESV